MARLDSSQKIISTDKARQGRWGRHVLIILVVGLILAMVAWAAAEFYGASIEPEDGTTSAMTGTPAVTEVAL